MRQTTILSHFLSGSRRGKRRQSSSSESEGRARASDSDSDVRAIGFEEAQDDDSESDAEAAPQPRRSTRLDSSPSKKRTRIASPAPPTSSPPHQPESEQDGSPRASGSRRAKAITVVDSDSEQDARPARKRKKVVRGVRPATPDDEDEDIDALSQENVLDTRLRGPSKKSKFSQALERMKQRKKPRVVSDDEDQDDDDNDEDEEDDGDRPFVGAKPTDEYNDSDEGSVDDFIVDDDGDAEDVVLPSAFRVQQNLSHHFKIICQYYVHLACAKNKAKFVKLSQNNEYFAEPLGVMRRKLSGIQDSLVTSSVWRTDFKNALRAYPDLALEQMTFSIPYCDACHIGGRVSTIVGHLSGSRYDKTTLENISDRDHSKDKDPLPKQFHLGRFCARRTRCFHSFAHWEHELYNALQLRVRNIEGWRKTDPDEIMESLDKRGVVEQEWKRMNDMMESARNLEVAAKRGEDDGDL